MIQKIKKPVSILLTVLMVFSVFAVVPFTASAATNYEVVDVTNIVKNASSVSELQAALDDMVSVSVDEGKVWEPPTKSGYERLILYFIADAVRFCIYNNGAYVNNAGLSDYDIFKAASAKFYYLKQVAPTTHTVTWNNWDGTTLETDTDVAKGTTPTYDGETPTKPEDANNTYTFSGWKNGETTYAPNAALPAVSGDVTYTAQYTATAKTFKAYAKKLTGETYTIENLTGETTVAQLKEIIADQTDIPATAQRLIFSGKQLEDAKTLAEYNIEKESTIHLIISGYTVTWLNYDNSELGTKTVQYGATPSYDGETPTKPADAQYAYTFAGWKNGDTVYAPGDTLPAVTGDVTYTATFEPKKLIAGHTLTLDGNIGINFYIDPSAAGLEPGQSGTLKVDFAWANSDPLVNVVSQSKTVEVNSSNYTQVGDLIKVTCKVCAAEMSCDVRATVALNGKTETEDYCVRDYCDTILDSDSEFSQNYIEENGEAKYAQLCDLVTKMLDYGAKAQTVFKINTEDLANSALDYEMEDVTAAMIEEAVFAANGSNTTTDFNAVASALGAKWYTTSLIYLTENTLRVYFVKNTSAFNPSDYQGNKANYYYYVEKSDIAAADLDKHQTFTVGNQTFKYSALDFAKLMITGNAEPSSKELAKALYWYNQAANVFFGGDEPVIPVEPTDPTSPTDSTDPTSPDNPVHPTEPFHPTEPNPIEP